MSLSYKLLEKHYLKDLDKWFSAKDSLYEYNPGKCIMPIEFFDFAERILNFEVREDDVWLVSFPRSGSTWVQEMVWLIGNNLNFEKASREIQQLRAPMIEMSIYFGKNIGFCSQFGGDSVEFVKNMPSPRFIKSHLPYQLLPYQLKTVKPTVIYIARNPKDLYCSYYPHMQLFYGLKASFEEFAHYFMKGKIPIGCQIDHNLAFWKLRYHSNVLFLRYEDVKNDTKGVIKALAKLLQKPIVDDQIDQILEFLSLEKMKKNPSVNMERYVADCKRNGHSNSGENFIGTGQVETWRKYMTDDLSKAFNDWIDKKTEGTTFKY